MVAQDFVELHNNRMKDTVAQEVVDLEIFASDVDCQLKGHIKKFHKVEFFPGARMFPFWETCGSSSPVLQEPQYISSFLPSLPYSLPIKIAKSDQDDEPWETTH